jgi:hypothetical protein
LQIKRFGLGLLAAAASLAWAGTAFAGVAVPARLDGTFLFEDQGQTDANQACVVVDDGFFGVFGEVVGTSGACTVEIGYNTTVPHKASGTVLKDDNTGSAKASQQVETLVFVEISGAECSNLLDSAASPSKCKVSGSVKGAEGAPDTTDSGKVSLSCNLGANGSELGELTQGQIDTILDAFSGRNDVKINGNGQLSIKTKGVPNTGGHLCI